MATNPDDPRSPFRQIADNLRELIESGEIEAGSRLPSTRDLMAEYGAANQTIQKALAILRTEGLIETVPSRGSFVRNNSTKTASASPTPDFLEFRKALESLARELTRVEQRVDRLEQEAIRFGEDH